MLKFILLLVRNTTCIPGYQERFNLIISLVDRKSSNPFLVHLLDHLRSILTKTLPYSVSKIFFVGSVQEIGEHFREFKSKMIRFSQVVHVNSSQLESDMLKYVDKEQLEKKFGGVKDNLVEYWPPKEHTSPDQSLDDEIIGEKGCIPFFIYEEDYQKFRTEHMQVRISIGQRLMKVPANMVFKQSSSLFTTVGRDQTKVVTETKSTEQDDDAKRNSPSIPSRQNRLRNQSLSPPKKTEEEASIHDDVDNITTMSQFQNMQFGKTSPKGTKGQATGQSALNNANFSKKNLKAKELPQEKQTTLLGLFGCCDGR